MSELKNCPFCGGEPNLELFNDGFFDYARIRCCNLIFDWCDDKTGEKVVTAWNRRAEEDKKYRSCMGCPIPEGVTDEEVAEALERPKAKAEGRLVVLSTPMIPLVQSDDPMDSDVYCPACGNTLSGGWPDYHPDQEWTMCQCFHCGQSIDDTKVLTKAEAEQALKNGGEEAWTR